MVSTETRGSSASLIVFLLFVVRSSGIFGSLSVHQEGKIWEKKHQGERNGSMVVRIQIRLSKIYENSKLRHPPFQWYSQLVDHRSRDSRQFRRVKGRPLTNVPSSNEHLRHCSNLFAATKSSSLDLPSSTVRLQPLKYKLTTTSCVPSSRATSEELALSSLHSVHLHKFFS